MTTIVWRPGLELQQDPGDILDYDLDFTNWLEGETIAAATVTASGCTAVTQATTATAVKVRASAVAGLDASFTVHLTTNSGQEVDRTVRLRSTQL